MRSQKGRGGSEEGDPYLVFRVRGQELALPSASVHEIRVMPSAKEAPVAAESQVVGTIALHGQFIPVVDLGRHFGHPPSNRNTRRYAIVVPFDYSEGQQFLIGLLVDGVSNVVKIQADRIGPPDGSSPPGAGGRVRINGRFKHVLDPARLLTKEQIGAAWGLLPSSLVSSVA